MTRELTEVEKQQTIELLHKFDSLLRLPLESNSQINVGDYVLYSCAPHLVKRKDKKDSLTLSDGTKLPSWCRSVSILSKEDARLIVSNWELYRGYIVSMLSKQEFVDRLKAVDPATFEYALFNRPAVEAAPKGWQPCQPACERFTYGTITYDRKLTDKEVYDYELYPVSPNAFNFQVGDRVLVNDCDTATVVQQEMRNRYVVRFDAVDATESIHSKAVARLI